MRLCIYCGNTVPDWKLSCCGENHFEEEEEELPGMWEPADLFGGETDQPAKDLSELAREGDPAASPEQLPIFPPSEEMIAAGAHALSEWLSDFAPLNEHMYREPARACFQAMMNLKGDQS